MPYPDSREKYACLECGREMEFDWMACPDCGWKADGPWDMGTEGPESDEARPASGLSGPWVKRVVWVLLAVLAFLVFLGLF